MNHTTDGAESGECTEGPVGALGVAACGFLRQSAPLTILVTAFRVFHEQPLSPFRTDEMYNPLHIFNIPVLPWTASTMRLAGDGGFKTFFNRVFCRVGFCLDSRF